MCFQSSWDYNGLLRLGTHFALTSIQEPPEEFDEDDFRIPESSNFYYQCVKPADARCSARWPATSVNQNDC